MLTRLYPMVQFKKDTWEIDEFDCASIFLLVGDEKALLIDCGMGIGDLRGAVEMITDKPIIVVISHGHIDHTGNTRQFEEIWMHPADQNMPIPHPLERRKFDIEHIARRQKGSLGLPYTMFQLYPYDINKDLREPSLDEDKPIIHDLYDGQRFDLGGGRIVTAYECPGHSAGEMIFLDEMTKTLFVGDALNYNLSIMSGGVPLETAARYLRRIRDMGASYDEIYNGHHDFRPLGAPLGQDCLRTVIEICEDVLQGNISPITAPNFWGQSLPLTKEAKKDTESPVTGNYITVQKERNYLRFNADCIYEKD